MKEICWEGSTRDTLHGKSSFDTQNIQMIPSFSRAFENMFDDIFCLFCFENQILIEFTTILNANKWQT